MTGLALACLAAFVAGSALQQPGYYDSHDGLLNVHRLYQLERCVADGQIPCRWVPDMGRGYGYPLFNFYPPLATNVALWLRGLGLGVLTAVKGAMAVALLLAATGMYAIARRHLGTTAGAVAAVLYTLAPYVAVDVYVRGALAETFGLALLPWVFFAGERVVRREPGAGPACAAAWAALLLAHPLTALMAGAPYALWLGVWLLRAPATERARTLGVLALAHALALGLAAWFVVPSIAELPHVHAGTLTSLYDWARFENNFLEARELFAVWPAWGYGPFRSQGGMALFLGPLQWAVAAAAGVALAVRARRGPLGEADAAAATLLACGAVAAALTLAVSEPLWELATPLAWLQFPWRFLSIASFGAAFSGGFLVWSLAVWPRVAAGATALLCIAAVSTAWTWFQPSTMHVVRDEALANRREVAKSVHGLFDFLPAGVDLQAFRAAPPPLAPPPASSQQARIRDALRLSDRIELEALVPDAGVGAGPAIVRIESFAFPGWRLTIDGEPAEIAPVDDPIGRLHVQVPPGRHRVRAQLEDTPVRRAANLTSGLSGAVLLAWLALGFRAALRRRAGAE